MAAQIEQQGIPAGTSIDEATRQAAQVIAATEHAVQEQRASAD